MNLLPPCLNYCSRSFPSKYLEFYSALTPRALFSWVTFTMSKLFSLWTLRLPIFSHFLPVWTCQPHPLASQWLLQVAFTPPSFSCLFLFLFVSLLLFVSKAPSVSIILFASQVPFAFLILFVSLFTSNVPLLSFSITAIFSTVLLSVYLTFVCWGQGHRIAWVAFMLVSSILNFSQYFDNSLDHFSSCLTSGHV